MEIKREKKKSEKTKIIAVIFVTLINVLFAGIASAEVPRRLIYEARLLESGTQTPKTTEHDFRFSFWAKSPVEIGDVAAGSINAGADNYAGWQEVIEVLPEENGYLTIELGGITPLPAIDGTEHLYLQVEVKETGDPDTAYEILDTSPLNPLVDRAPIGSVPYALSADTIDGAEVGVVEGSIVLLGPDDQFPISTIPGGTNENSFVLDYNDDAAGTIGLVFGNTLNKVLSWDVVGSYFNFNDSVNIEGDLTLTGTVDGVDVSALGVAVDDLVANGVPADASAINIEGVDGHYYTDSDVETVIDELDEAIFGINNVMYDRSIILNTSYGGVVYLGDGSDNIGRLYLGTDDTQDENYYEWTTSRATLQDYDIIVDIPVPATFNQWEDASPWSFNYRTSVTDSSLAKFDIFIYDTNGDPVTLLGTSQNLTNMNWSQAVLDFSGSPVFTPGETFKIVLRLSAKSEQVVNMGEIKLNYNG